MHKIQHNSAFVNTCMGFDYKVLLHYQKPYYKPHTSAHDYSCDHFDDLQAPLHLTARFTHPVIALSVTFLTGSDEPYQRDCKFLAQYSFLHCCAGLNKNEAQAKWQCTSSCRIRGGHLHRDSWTTQVPSPCNHPPQICSAWAANGHECLPGAIQYIQIPKQYQLAQLHIVFLYNVPTEHQTGIAKIKIFLFNCYW